MSTALQNAFGREFNSRQVHHEGLPGFDGCGEFCAHAGTDAHRNENQTTTANSYELPMAA